MSLARERAAAVGQETQCILAEGHYRTSAGASIDLRALFAQAQVGTRSYPPESDRHVPARSRLWERADRTIRPRE